MIEKESLSFQGVIKEWLIWLYIVNGGRLTLSKW
jgi:hypothetical protein